MKPSQTATCLLLLLAVIGQLPGQEPPADLQRRVAEILVLRCVECHGTAVRKPKGEFGFADDLSRVATKLVKPGSLDDSDLWFVLTDEQHRMPPKKAKAGPLTLEELALVRWSILAGAPADPSAARTEPARPAGDDEVSWPWLGDFHPIVVHFPIALLIVAALADVLAVLGWRAGDETVVRYCLWLGALSAFVAAFTGWSLGDQVGGDAVETHRWWGVGTLSVAAIALLVTHLGGARRRALRRVILLLLAAAVGVTGHLGGEMVHGSLWG